MFIQRKSCSPGDTVIREWEFHLEKITRFSSIALTDGIRRRPSDGGWTPT